MTHHERVKLLCSSTVIKKTTFLQLKIMYTNMHQILPFDIVRAGDHCDRRISKQILPLLFMFG